MVIVIAFLNSWGTDGSYGNENTDKSVLSVVGRTLTPAFAPLGIQEENWPATVGIFTGILAKEVVVGTLDAIYSQMSPQTTAITEQETTSFLENIQAAVATIPANLSEVFHALFHPFGGDPTEDSENMTTAVNSGTFGAMVTRFDGQIGAFAYLLFILLYSPCAAAIAAIYRETNGQWAIFSVLWTTGLAYLVAVIFYQTATFGQHPMNSIIWISGLLTAFALILLILYYYGQQAQTARSNQ
jgi:ferrous iron transport protein B